MLLLAIAATAALAQPPSEPARPAVHQATATVRILSGARIWLGMVPADAQVRAINVRDSQGSSTTVRLIEFP